MVWERWQRAFLVGRIIYRKQEADNPGRWWSNEEVGHNQEAKKEINTLFGAADTF